MNSQQLGLCSQPGHESTPTSPSLWESRRGKESQEAAQERHRRARVLCRRCPLLAACERALTDYEYAGAPVDGVMAARYSDVPFGSQWSADVQTHCAGCNIRLIPRHARRGHAKKNRRPHAGEGLCTQCHPLLSAHHPPHTERKTA